MRKPAVLITGASGEIGHGLIEQLSAEGDRAIVTLDLAPLAPALAGKVQREVIGSIMDRPALDRILAEYEVDVVYHLAALLSTRSEFSPLTAHEVNVGGTLNLLEFAQQQSSTHGRPVIFMYPSSIAVYGLTRETKIGAGKVREDQFTESTTMYGCNKLYCEQLGRYYMKHYKQLSAEASSGHVDFRGIRFPGLISAVTVPSGGTSDFAPEMIHAAAKGEAYACFVREDARIPFMAMPDGVAALLKLAKAPRERLTLPCYNIGAFNPSAGEVEAEVRRAFPNAQISYKIDTKRQGIVDSWPADVDDAAARRDWGFAPTYNFESAFREYLIPTIKARYS